MKKVPISEDSAQELIELIEAQVKQIEPVVIFIQHQLGLPMHHRLDLSEFSLRTDDDDLMKAELSSLILKLEKYDNLKKELLGIF